MLKAIHEYILVKELEYTNRITSSWIIIAGDKSKNETGKGEIVALWSKAEEAGELSVWDIIYFNRYIPHEVMIEWERLITLPRRDVQAKEVK